MNRKAFLALLGGFLGALAVGAKSKPAAVPMRPPGHTPFDDEYFSKFDAIEVCGVSIYCDPYCPKDTVYIVRTRSQEFVDMHNWGGPYVDANLPLLCESESFDRRTAIQYVCGAMKRNGSTPDLGIVHPKRWEELWRDMRAEDRIIYPHFYGKSLVGQVKELQKLGLGINV